jgi:hypothetical protein
MNEGGKLAGGNPARGRVENDFYATHPDSTKAILEKEYNVHIEDGIVKMTGEEILAKINKTITDFNAKFSLIQKGVTETKPILDKYGKQQVDKNGNPLSETIHKALEKFRIKDFEITYKGMPYKVKQYDIEAVIQAMNKSVYNQEPFDITIGIDGLNELSKSIFAKELHDLYLKTRNDDYYMILSQPEGY